VKLSPITPTIGRIVLFRSDDHTALGNGATEVPAIVVRTWGDESPYVNLTVFRDHDTPLSVGSVPYDDGERLSAHCGWRWMPYQLATAPKLTTSEDKA